MDQFSKNKTLRALGLSKDVISALYDDPEDPGKIAEFRDLIAEARAIGDLNAALKIATSAEKSLPRTPEFSIIRARTLMAMNCFVDAAQILERLHAKHPKQSHITVFYAQTLTRLGETDKAHALFTSVSADQDAFADAQLGLLRALKSHRQVQAALVFGGDAIAAHAGHLPLVREHADTLIQAHHYDTAIALLDKNLAISGHADGLFLLRADIALQMGNLPLAERILKHCPKGVETLKRYRQLDEMQQTGPERMTVFAKVQCIEILGENEPEQLNFNDNMRIADLRFLIGDWREALRHYRLSGVNKSRNRMRTLRIASCHFRLLEFSACEKALDRALAQSPLSPDALSLRAQIDLLQGNLDRYLSTTQQLFDQKGRRQMHHGVRLFKAHIRRLNPAAADAVMAQMLETAKIRFEPELIRCLLQFSNAETAQDISAPWRKNARQNPEFAKLLDAVAVAANAVPQPEKAPPPERARETQSFDPSALAKIGKRANKPAQNLPVPNALIAAWELADQADITFETWQNLVRRATRCSSDMAARTPTQKDIQAYTDFPDSAALGAYANGNAPIILATTHFGPLVSSALETNLFQHHKSLYLRTEHLHGLRESTMITTNGDPQMAAVALVKAIKSGISVSCAVDAPIFWQSNGKTQTGASGHIFGRPVTISATPVKLALAFGAPIFWLQPLWKDKRITFEVEQMHQPDPDIPFQETADAWAHNYLQRLEKVMRSGPENQNLNAPMWQHLVFHGDAPGD